jgi:hypothetical protein
VVLGSNMANLEGLGKVSALPCLDGQVVVAGFGIGGSGNGSVAKIEVPMVRCSRGHSLGCRCGLACQGLRDGIPENTRRTRRLDARCGDH